MLSRLVDAWPEIRDAHFTPDCCLNATRVLMEACRASLPRASCRPLAVEATAVNAQAIRLMAREFTPEEWWSSGAHFLACGPRDEGVDENAWPGHLVLVVNDRWLVDGSAAQMARPAKDLFVPSVVIARLKPRHLTGAPIEISLSKGGCLIYRALPASREHLSFPGFQRHAGNLAVVRRLIDATEAQ